MKEQSCRGGKLEDRVVTQANEGDSRKRQTSVLSAEEKERNVSLGMCGINAFTEKKVRPQRWGI